MKRPKITTRTAGILYLVIIVSGIFAHFLVRGSLKVPGDVAATAANIAGSESLFRLGIAGDLVMIASDVALALLFFLLLEPVNRGLSLLAAFFRLGQATILGINLVNLFLVLQLVGGGSQNAAISGEQRASLAHMFLEAHDIGYTIGLSLFAFSILVVGYLVVRSGYIPRILGYGLVIAGVAYLVDTFARVLLTDYAAYADILSVVVFAPAIIAELAFALWLLLRGVKLADIETTSAIGPLQPATRT